MARTAAIQKNESFSAAQFRFYKSSIVILPLKVMRPNDAKLKNNCLPPKKIRQVNPKQNFLKSCHQLYIHQPWGKAVGYGIHCVAKIFYHLVADGIGTVY